jgi:methionyl aminopeptidase
MSRSKFQLKTNENIVAMRRAGLATAAALEAVKSAIRPGISTLELDSLANKAIVDFGGRSNFQLVPGYFHTICASINDEVVHGIPSAERILQPGDIVSIDAGAEVDGWNGDAAMTFIVPGGDADLAKARQNLSDVTENSLWAGIAALASATRLNDIGTAIEKSIEAAGKFGILEHYVGHGIGRSMHEDPPVFNYRTRDGGPKVKPGLVIAIEPMVTAGSEETKILDDEWTVSTVDGSDASHWEHTVARHANGIWVLTEPDGGESKLAKFGIKPVPLGN